MLNLSLYLIAMLYARVSLLLAVLVNCFHVLEQVVVGCVDIEYILCLDVRRSLTLRLMQFLTAFYCYPLQLCK